MTFVVDIRQPEQAKAPVYKAFITETLGRIALKNTGHHFVFITGKGRQDLPFAGSNVELVSAGRFAASRLFRNYWLNLRLPALLKKKQASLLITTDGTCPPVAGVLQYLLIPGTGLGQRQGADAARYLRLADRIIFFSESQRAAVTGKYKIPPQKTYLLKAAATAAFQPVSFEVKQAVKTRYASGKEYFIYTGPVSGEKSLVNLLKAFSIFKKRQQSGFRLVLAGAADKKDKLFAAALASYKFREDVILTGPLTLSEKAGLVAAAYALIDPAGREGPGIPALEAAACGVPAIAASDQPLLEKGAFLEADSGDPAEMAGQMMLLYKDEALRNRLIKKAGAAVKQQQTEEPAGLLWDLIMKDLS